MQFLLIGKSKLVTVMKQLIQERKVCRLIGENDEPIIIVKQTYTGKYIGCIINNILLALLEELPEFTQVLGATIIFG